MVMARCQELDTELALFAHVGPCDNAELSLERPTHEVLGGLSARRHGLLQSAHDMLVLSLVLLPVRCLAGFRAVLDDTARAVVEGLLGADRAEHRGVG